MNKIALTPEQRDIVDFVRVNPTSHLLVNAVAGAGKTFTIQQLSKELKGSSIFASFGRDISQELQKRVRISDAEFKSLHGLGYSIISDNLKDVRISPNKTLGLITDKMLDKAKIHKNKRFGTRIAISKIVSLAKNLGLFRNKEELIFQCVRYGLSTEEKLIDIALNVIKEGFSKKNIKSIDFDDMVSYPNYFRDVWKFTAYDHVVVDEFQDTSYVQLQMLQDICAGRIIALGDGDQAIYFFRGATDEAIRILLEVIGAKELGCRTSFRCDSSIATEANHIIKGDFRARDDAAKGEVRKGSLIEAVVGDAVVCRKNSDCIKSWFRLFDEGKHAIIKGKMSLDIYLNILQDGKIVLIKDIYSYLAKQRQKAIDHMLSLGVSEDKAQRARKVRELEDIETAFRKMEDYCPTVSKMIEFLEQMGEYTTVKDKKGNPTKVKKKGNFITISTVHKFKGLEANRVFYVNRYESTFDEKLLKTKLDIQSAHNIDYVAVTRAKHSLVLVSFKNFEDERYDLYYELT